MINHYNQANPAISEFVIKNWHSMSYNKMATQLHVNVGTIKKYAKRLGIGKKIEPISRAKVAMLLEYFANGWTVAAAARTLGLNHTQSKNIIERHFLVKQRSYLTITLVLESKINF